MEIIACSGRRPARERRGWKRSRNWFGARFTSLIVIHAGEQDGYSSSGFVKGSIGRRTARTNKRFLRCEIEILRGNVRGSETSARRGRDGEGGGAVPTDAGQEGALTGREAQTRREIG